MTSFEQLYQGLFPQVACDRLSNYKFIRRLETAKTSTKNLKTHIDLVQPILGPVTRRIGFELCVLKCIPVLRNDASAQTRLLREVAIHRAVTLGSSSEGEVRTLPLLSHFIAKSTLGDQERRRKRGLDKDLYMILVLPYCQKGNLAEYFSQRLDAKSNKDTSRTLNEGELRWTLLEVARGLERCHDRGIVHRDVKAENILLWEPSHTSKEEKIPARLLLSDFGLSTWVDDERDIGEGSDKEDSTVCGTWEYISPETAIQRRTGPEVDVWALGCLCVFLLTGSLPFASSAETHESSISDVRVEAQSLHERVEKLAVGDWEKVRAKLPHHLSYECREILEGMLQVDAKRRLTIRQIISHPFMRSSLLDSPLDSLEGVRTRKKPAKEVPQAINKEATKAIPLATPAPTRKALGEIGNSSSSSTTLRSVMQRVSPGMFASLEESVHEKRKTPFGVVKVSKQKDVEEEKMDARRTILLPKGKLDWGNGYGSRGLLSVRQRIQGGKVEITKDGSVALMVKGKAFIVISPDGSRVDVQSYGHPSIDDHQIEQLCQMAASWLNRHRRKSTIAGFMLPSAEQYTGTERERPGSGAVEYIAYCSIKGNGPLPDYQVRFAAVEEGGSRARETKVAEWNVEVQVHVQRMQNYLTLHAKVEGLGKQSGLSWKECTLPIKGAFSQAVTTWELAGSPVTSAILQDLSKREQKAIARSLDAARSVDSVFKTSLGG